MLLDVGDVPAAEHPGFAGSAGFMEYVRMVDAIVDRLRASGWPGVTAEKVEWLLFARERNTTDDLYGWLEDRRS